MNDVEEFLEWAKQTRKSLDSIITKLENKIDLSDNDHEFLNDAFIVFEQGSL